MYVDFVRKMPSDDDKYSSQVKILAANNTMHAVNPVYQNDAFDESLDDKDTTDYVVMSSQARPSTIDETENTDYIVMSSQARQSNIENTGYVVVSSQARNYNLIIVLIVIQIKNNCTNCNSCLFYTEWTVQLLASYILIIYK